MKYILTFILTMFISVSSQAQTFQWAKNIGSPVQDESGSIAVDSSGNIFIVGSFMGTADFDPGVGIYNLTSAGNLDIYITKIDSNGNFLWAKSIGSASGDNSHEIKINSTGDIYLSGHFSGTADFDPGNGIYNITPEGTDFFILKLDNSGNFIWVKNMAGIGYGTLYSMVLDANNNIYATGDFNDTVDFDPGPAEYKVRGGLDVFILKLDMNGDFQWVKKVGSNGGDGGASIALDNSGNIYTTGYFNGTVDFNPDAGVYNLTASGNFYDCFILKLDNAGNFIWAKRFGSTDGDFSNAIAIDANNNVYTTGMFELTVDFDPGAPVYNLTASGDRDIFILKLDANGNFIWAKKIGGSTNDVGGQINLDNTGTIYVSGSYSGSVDFDPGAGTYNFTSVANTDDVFIVKLDTMGNFILAKSMGGNYPDLATACVIDAGHNIYTTGTFMGTADYNPDAPVYNLVSVGNKDIFIHKYRDCVVNTAVTQTGATLIANVANAAYQWLRCNPYQNIPGETNQSFTATADGDYAIAITEGGCTDTSACYAVIGIGINEYSKRANILLYPNPVTQNLYIESDRKFDHATIKIFNVTGNILTMNNNITAYKYELNMSCLAPGIYFAEISDAGYKYIRIITRE